MKSLYWFSAQSHLEGFESGFVYAADFESAGYAAKKEAEKLALRYPNKTFDPHGSMTIHLHKDGTQERHKVSL